MKKTGFWLSVIALIIAVVGATVAIIVYLRQHGFLGWFDDMEEDFFDDDDYCFTDYDEPDTEDELS